MCAYAGSGDVLVIQELLHTCSESQSYVVSAFFMIAHPKKNFVLIDENFSIERGKERREKGKRIR